ncbi:MAG: hypothetical protein ABIV94_09620, partial [Acidimicrobiales bacterium]
MNVTADFATQVRAVMEAHWLPRGYTVPNAVTYPFAWLWDSCFHSLIWAELGDDERALRELTHVFRMQDETGFVPHIDYERDPTHLASFWGRDDASTITQPPVHGHVIAALRRRGITVPDELQARAEAHLGWFLRARRHPSGLIAITQPWETGCDDSARFDHWGADDPAKWFEVKNAFVREPDLLDCAPVSLSAIVAWSCRELGLDDEGLADALAQRWDGERRTWIDAGAAEGTSGRIRTLEGLLPQLVDPRPEVVADLADPDAYGAPFGPRGAHASEPSYDPTCYWRGP